VKFEHLVEINDLLNPLVTPLDRRQLWRGLVRRAENPLQFVYGLDECLLGERGTDFVERRLRFGERWVEDRVTFLPLQATYYDVRASADYPASRLCISIEEPAPGRLYLRFRYELAGEVSPPDSATAELRRQAWFAADLDTASHIRGLVEGGQLG
jgi:hypothetical protein